ncbi:hypothetical protein EDB92DRAFT_1934437 [Lactarius akahatsu]|uniref:Uncharacterized protein n=1 Tax=Lactarius akahatsu TaxID=416441 RepID=A0AAD4LI52_9AGAM|nr:hypothetical protein EDB92DRAFT_1934437 [Lactarius akahatsu]
MRRRFSPISVVLVVILVLLGQASAAPTPSWLSTNKTLFPRQKTPPQPFTTQTVRTTQTDAGPVTETCTLTFTPVIGANGEPLVQVVRSCTMTAGAPPPPGSTTTRSSPPQSTSTPPSQTSTSSPSASTPSIASTPASVQSSPTNTTTSTTASSGSNSSSTPPPSFTPVFSKVPLPSVMSVSSPPASSPTPTSTPEPAVVVTDALTDAQTSQSTSPVATSTASPETAPDTSPTPSSAAQGAFQIPGKKISVLPIGLGIFAGISVIALIVVGLVTYERTKYRKIFRQRKLAEQGAGPGYGGTGS